MIRDADEHEELMREDLASPTVLVVRGIKGWIESGELLAGEPVPSIRALSEQFEVTQHAVYMALQQLERDGYLGREGRSRVVSRLEDRSSGGISGAGGASVGEVGGVKTDVMVLSRDHWYGDDHVSPGHLWYIVMGVFHTLRHERSVVRALDPETFSTQSFLKILNDRPDGVVAFRDAMAMVPVTVLLEIQAAGLPLVVYGYGDALSSFDTVLSDQSAGMYALTQYFIERGCRKILRYWEMPKEGWNAEGEIPAWLAMRNEGYERAMRDYGLELLDAYYSEELPIVVEDRRGFRMRSYHVAGHLAEVMAKYGEVDAVIAITDGVSFYVREACRILRHDGILVGGYDNYWHQQPERGWSGDLRPMVTVDKRNRKIGGELVDLLLARIRGELGEEPEHRLVSPELVVLDDMVKTRRK